jgi:hypothetical protein
MLRRLIGKLLQEIEAIPHSNSSMLPVTEFRKPAPLDQSITYSSPKPALGAIEYYKLDERRAYPATVNGTVTGQESVEALVACLPGRGKSYFKAKEQPPSEANEYFTIVNYT